jgi:peptide chain release factor 2
MNTIHLQVIQACQENLISLEKMSPIAQLQKRLVELDEQINEPGLWADPRRAGAIMKERAQASESVSYLTGAKESIEFYDELIKTEELNDKDTADLLKIHAQLDSMVFKQMMSDPIDKNAAILSINSGAGGLEACDFSSMLLRMYSRYCAANGFEVEVVDIKETDGGYIDSVTLMITGDFAYGYLKNETGTMRLVRNSPFNSDNARHTSFSAIRVLPNIDDTIDIKIEEKDLEIYGQIGGGGPKAGGQARNKTASACRIKHFPSGISFVICTERSFHTNRKTALTLLKAKLYDIEIKKRTDATDELNSSLTDIAFGSQIRSFILSPYSLVKDHRTKYERADTEAVLNGDIHELMLSSLKWSISK